MSVGLAFGFALAGSVGALGLASVFLILPREVRSTVLPALIAYATGTLLGAAFLGLLPEAIANAPADAVLATALGGIFLFFLLEKLLIWRHDHLNGPHHQHADGHRHTHSVVGPLLLVGDAVHNFVDGVVIAITFDVSTELGIVVVRDRGARDRTGGRRLRRPARRGVPTRESVRVERGLRADHAGGSGTRPRVRGRAAGPDPVRDGGCGVHVPVHRDGRPDPGAPRPRRPNADDRPGRAHGRRHRDDRADPRRRLTSSSDTPLGRFRRDPAVPLAEVSGLEPPDPAVWESVPALEH